MSKTNLVLKIEQTKNYRGARRVIVQNENPFTTAYSLYVDQVYRYVLLRVGDTHVAEDITSETFLSALEHYDSFHGKGTLGAWIFGIARHKVSDYFRTSRPSASLDVVSNIASAELSPMQIVQHQLELEQVHQALQSLSLDRVDALTLRIFGELSVNEISQVLGKSESAIRMLIYRAIQDLKTRLIPLEGVER